LKQLRRTGTNLRFLVSNLLFDGGEANGALGDIFKVIGSLEGGEVVVDAEASLEQDVWGGVLVLQDLDFYLPLEDLWDFTEALELIGQVAGVASKDLEEGLVDFELLD
jgi:hypothetical protein